MRIWAPSFIARLGSSLAGSLTAAIEDAMPLSAKQDQVPIRRVLEKLRSGKTDATPLLSPLKAKVKSLEDGLASIQSKWIETQALEAELQKRAKPAAVAAETESTTVWTNHLDDYVILRTPAQIKADTDKVIRLMTRVYNEIASLDPAECIFESVFQRMARLENRTKGESSALYFLQQVSPDKPTREASNEAARALSEFAIDAGARVDLYRAAKAAVEKLGDQSQLDDEDRRLVEKIMQGYERQGLGLPDAKREELTAIRKRIADLARDFARNKAEDKTFVAVTRDELAGMPESYISSLALVEEGDAKGSLKVTMSYPDTLPLLRKCTNAETRRKVDVARMSVCPENQAILEEMVELRASAAAILGFKNHAHFRLELNMAKNPETVLGFLEDLRDKLLPHGRVEYQKLLDLKNAERAAAGLPAEDALHSWDTSYYSNLLVEREFNFDQDELKPYFSYNTFLAALLKLYEQLFNIRIEEVTKEAALWHPDVTAWRVFDHTSTYRGAFYLDMHPREGAFGHAAVFGLRPGCLLSDGTYQTPLVAMKCNFTKPSKDAPSLLTHDEMVTLAHEAGHIFHHILGSRIKYGMFSGTATARDFSEAPSQLLENWIWEKEALVQLSSHYETGAKVPTEILDRLIATKNVGAAMFNLRQLRYGLFDMAVHTIAPGTKAPNTTELYDKMSREVSLIAPPAGTCGQCTFSHITGGYDSGYYGYLWSLVYAADMYSRFEAEGIFNSGTAAEYVREVLAPGGSRDEFVSLRKFLGREPNSEAFLRGIGL
ncbi:metalloendopeptidase [Blastocladiella emersonii ATCC 22665]|nr:metalloendopeptidase [Blastocladiella emersonii ATCC 22665]